MCGSPLESVIHNLAVVTKIGVALILEQPQSQSVSLLALAHGTLLSFVACHS